MSDIKSVIRARDELARIVSLREKELREIFKRNDKNVRLYLEAEEKLEKVRNLPPNLFANDECYQVYRKAVLDKS